MSCTSAGCRFWRRRRHAVVAGDQGSMLLEPDFDGAGQRPPARTAEAVSGSATGFAAGSGSEIARPSSLGSNYAVAQTDPTAQAQAAAGSQTGAYGGGDDGDERKLWLANGGRGAASWLGSSQAESLCVRRATLQLDVVRDASAAVGIHRHFGLRASVGVLARRGPCVEAQPAARRLAAIQAMVAVGLV